MAAIWVDGVVGVARIDKVTVTELYAIQVGGEPTGSPRMARAAQVECLWLEQ